jgi:plasmid stabilization system protein ParE
MHGKPLNELSLEGMTMPEAWSEKRERQYEHIKDSYEDRGVSKDEAEERAARTVNKERREEGETKDSDD